MSKTIHRSNVDHREAVLKMLFLKNGDEAVLKMLFLKNGDEFAQPPGGLMWKVGDPLPELDLVVNFIGVCGDELEVIARCAAAKGSPSRKNSRSAP
jgi:hypothetical protein